MTAGIWMSYRPTRGGVEELPACHEVTYRCSRGRRMLERRGSESLMVDGTLWQGTRPCPPHMGAAGAVYRGRGLEDRRARDRGLAVARGKQRKVARTVVKRSPSCVADGGLEAVWDVRLRGGLERGE